MAFTSDGQHHFYTENIHYNKPGALDDFVDCTYVITLESSTQRHQSLYAQLEQYKPTRHIRVCKFKSFKQVRKPFLVEQNPANDILWSHYCVFKDALKQNYSTILVLEDDFIFNRRLLDPQVHNNIKDFVQSQQPTTLFTYSLGSIPFFISSYNYNYSAMQMIGGGVHAMIHPRQTIAKCASLIETLFQERRHVDIEDILNYTIPRYNYKDPLCCQLFTETDNFKEFWGKGVFAQIFFRIIFKVFGFQKKDTIFNSFDNSYYVVKVLHLVVYFTLIFVAMFFIQKLIYRKKN